MYIAELKIYQRIPLSVFKINDFELYVQVKIVALLTMSRMGDSNMANDSSANKKA